MHVVRVFDELIQNVDRNMGNLLIDTGWRAWMIDHSRAFRLHKKLKNPCGAAAMRSAAAGEPAGARRRGGQKDAAEVSDRTGDRRVCWRGASVLVAHFDRLGEKSSVHRRARGAPPAGRCAIRPQRRRSGAPIN